MLECVGDNFLYFGFGSNLLAARIHLQNPSAVFYTTACLSDYHLSFDRQSYTWMGASATIVPLPGDHVWGVVWLMKSSELSSLDDQEGVCANIYKVSAAIGKCCEDRLSEKILTNIFVIVINTYISPSLYFSLFIFQKTCFSAEILTFLDICVKNLADP